MASCGEVRGNPGCADIPLPNLATIQRFSAFSNLFYGENTVRTRVTISQGRQSLFRRVPVIIALIKSICLRLAFNHSGAKQHAMAKSRPKGTAIFRQTVLVAQLLLSIIWQNPPSTITLPPSDSSTIQLPIAIDPSFPASNDEQWARSMHICYLCTSQREPQPMNRSA
jgi:hypothetical protein